jgi:hypothetical protein
MMRRAVDIGKFKGYKVSDHLQFQMLQFADDTILMGEGSWDNLWTIKTLLRSFELVSGLKINFVKSKLYGLNIDSSFLSAASAFLSCRSDVIPFKFLGIPVGANPRRRETWKPVVESMSKRLNTWSSRHLSYGGRVTLINSVLSSLPLYFFSFFKAPKCIINQLVRIQRNFLWGGGVEDNKLCWVKWDQICLPRDKGGLGVKNLELFNLALLSKWKWRFLSDSEAMWAELLRFRYGHIPSILMGSVSYSNGKKDSIWWKDVIGKGRGIEEEWFRPNVGCCVGDGKDIGFWNFKWYGNNTFKELFPNLYVKEAAKDIKIADKLIFNGSEYNWRWQWVYTLSDMEEQQLTDLCELLVGFSIQPNCPDKWRWMPGPAGIFSVKSCYNLLLDLRQSVVLEQEVLEAIIKLWKNDVPSKIKVFGWRLLLQRLPTREALHHRGILNNTNDLSCVFCLQHIEDCAHLFFHCSFSMVVWEAVFNWIGKRVITDTVGWNHFSLFGTLFNYQKGGRTNHLLWLATTWNIWNLRNNVVFKGVIPNASTLLNDIKSFSWRWFSGRLAHNSCISFPDWCQDPMSFILYS